MLMNIIARGPQVTACLLLASLKKLERGRKDETRCIEVSGIRIERNGVQLQSYPGGFTASFWNPIPKQRKTILND